MSDKPISELRRRMLEDMAVRKLGAVSAPAPQPQANDQAAVDDQAATALAAPCPLLRRPHDRHRDLRGRLPAAARADHHHRQLMMVPSANCRGADHHRRRSWTGRDGACPMQRPPLQVEPQSPADRMVRRNPQRQPGPISTAACSARRSSVGSSAQPARSKSPERSWRPGGLPLAGSFPGGFRSDDGPGGSRVVAMGRHPKPFTKAVIPACRRRGRRQRGLVRSCAL